MWRRLVDDVGCLGVAKVLDEGDLVLAGRSDFYSEINVASMKSWPFSVESSTFRESSSFEIY